MDTIIFDSELKFRKHLIKNYNDIQNIILFEDRLDDVIYFYCFTNNELILSTKKSSIKDFEYYSNIYQKLFKKYELSIDYKTNNPKTLKLCK